ncbi:hypothetical protein SEA_ASHERTHEMAN_8 [Gordonia phage Ashertheman]|uniref:Uncharacterized protein n=6 Tax=Kroosvirus TaxID=2948789 RepID=A0A3G3M898_9CAUD|nr:hypothetical protein J1761_gp08 [Gordonia phage Kroos]YP_010001717.1 hypothetical protein J1763_gp08 [Gordonia phage YorkOnyx]YP_010001801.1 hypothetical protein J1764_gp08 [Gordonia phage Ashertheman]YP_010001886.1 hypothetical protein J1765_gp08 [Gordonia phage Gaea]YP_010001973.1 hypothetical protein J1766_gp09 [Gordonia phage Bizzy]YP_010002143.1 hypothetical protein J1768_gp09 [Gordonia phage Ribeye]URP21076.1 hypothetical protein SEA_FLATWOODS_9 [Gordonia phage Flatwoods]UTN91662.1 
MDMTSTAHTTHTLTPIAGGTSCSCGREFTGMTDRYPRNAANEHAKMLNATTLRSKSGVVYRVLEPSKTGVHVLVIRADGKGPVRYVKLANCQAVN